MRWRGGFSRILEFFNLTRLYFGIAVSILFSQQRPSFRDNSIFPPPKADKGHGLFLAAVPLATRANRESQRAPSRGDYVDRACGFEQLEKAPEYQPG